MADETEDQVKLKQTMEAFVQAMAKEKEQAKLTQAKSGLVFKINPVDIPAQVTSQSAVEGEYVKGQKPVTAMKINPYEAARKLRANVKLLATPTALLGPVEEALVELKAAMSGRSPRKKEQAYEAVLVELENFKTNTNALLKETQVLAQNIPTQPNLPTTSDETIVRAIIAILESNGRVKR